MNPCGTFRDPACQRLQKIQRALSGSHEGLHVSVIPSHSVRQAIEIEDAPYPLTEDEAFYFLEKVLEIPEPRKLLERNKHEFVDKFILEMNIQIPFTNLHFLSKNMACAYYPTESDCKEAIFNRHGGNCFYINIFTKALLDVLGFKSYHIGASVPGRKPQGSEDHVGVILCDLSYPGSRHLVDPGTLRPLYKAIPLDFKDSSIEYQFNFMRVKFFRWEHGILVSCSQVPKPKVPSSKIIESAGKFWKKELVYRMGLEKTRAYFLDKMRYSFNLPSLTPHIYKSLGMAVNIHGKCVLLGMVGHHFAVKYQHADPSQVELLMLSKDEFLDFLEKEISQFPRAMVERAIENAGYFTKMYSI